MTGAGAVFYQMSQVTYTKARDSLMIVCDKNHWYFALFVKVIYKCNTGPVLWNTAYIFCTCRVNSQLFAVTWL